MSTKKISLNYMKKNNVKILWKPQEYKAEISIYLALVLTVMLSLILTLIEGARISAIRMQIECVNDMGLNSIFAEYNRELLNQYDLLLIDTSYGTDNPSLAYTQTHMKNYMDYNFQVNKGFLGNKARDLLAIEVLDVGISNVSYATDGKGQVLKKQAITYMKDKVGLKFMDEVLSQCKMIQDNGLETKDIVSENRNVDNELNQLEREENGKKKKVHLNSPANKVNESKRIDILSLVLKEADEISTQAVRLEDYVQGRELQKGVGIPEGKELQGNTTEEVLFGEYLLEKCGSFTKKKQGSPLQYELEYLLAGNGSDRDNLTTVVNKLMMVRQVSNHIYLWTDSAKVAEVDGAAAAIASAVLMPEIQPLVKISLMFAWSYAESVGDVRILLNGGKIPLLKTSGDWRLQFSNLAEFKSQNNQKENGGRGLSYREYIRLFLLSMNRETKTMRFMDIVEMNMRTTKGNEKFRLDGCIDQLMAEVRCKSKFGYEYEIERAYSYE